VHEAVSEILVERARQDDNLNGMVLVSCFVHAAILLAIVFTPSSWRSRPIPNVTPMTIIMGGVEGPDAGGKTPIAGRPVQEVVPPDVKAPDVRPAAKPPEMVEPTKAFPKAAPKIVNKPDDKSKSLKTTKGAELKTGAAAANTGGVAVPFGGLSTGGGGAPTQGAFTDYANFCCPAYLNQMTDLIKRNWNKSQGASGTVQVKFVIQRDGTLGGLEVEKASNIPMLDLESQRAVVKTQRLPPLPREFTEPALTVHLIFEYHR